ncbi:hypothetical protein ZYGR_0N02610 [Zygosaccharomyces rouxii]|uniref:ZYRO0D06336p n=2 Tax=Zygosaccharomyces rouxii TaxID=4956 RepID=C5DVF6_ZYGRC|nr:uncharacterized protein ZYRO0D06336g [Zygosaccharomyces rouxii]KAH9200688.1 hypothetical protein LQ764DRAFT_97590 [Zygosaccharomyces rouxii]GAV48856.1 hypothetical protein ZYGR_0N02610 [Zygosaccharomyces rouxii]CAR27775.1 ZYRO0D06336p [Zygosaccharomyces rouxii]
MAPKDSNNCLRDVSNTRTSSHSPSTQGNVFKRLGTSPSMRYPNGLSKPPARVSPARKSPVKPLLQLTPKRIQSPECLREYNPKFMHSGGSPSIDDNLTSKVENRGSTTSILFPTSPTRTIFANERKIGGDGSLGRIRSRFTNGLLSPQKRLAPTPMKNRLEHAMESDNTSDNSNNELQAKNLFEKLKEAEKMEQETNQERSKTQPHKKSVKFELPRKDSKEALKKELQALKELLKEATRRQSELEVRLSKLEEGQD